MAIFSTEQDILALNQYVEKDGHCNLCYILAHQVLVKVLFYHIGFHVYNLLFLTHAFYTILWSVVRQTVLDQNLQP